MSCSCKMSAFEMVERGCPEHDPLVVAQGRLRHLESTIDKMLGAPQCWHLPIWARAILVTLSRGQEGLLAEALATMPTEVPKAGGAAEPEIRCEECNALGGPQGELLTRFLSEDRWRCYDRSACLRRMMPLREEARAWGCSHEPPCNTPEACGALSASKARKGRRCRACDQYRDDVGDGWNTLPLCAQCAKAHRMGYRCGEEASSLVGDPDELAPLRARMAKGRARYPNGCTLMSVLDEAGEVAHAVNKYESADRVRDELLDVASTAMRLYLGEVDTGLTIDGLVQRRTDDLGTENER